MAISTTSWAQPPTATATRCSWSNSRPAPPKGKERGQKGSSQLCKALRPKVGEGSERAARSLDPARGSGALRMGEAARDRLFAEALGNLVERAVEPVATRVVRRRRAEQRQLPGRDFRVANQVMHLHAGQTHPLALAHALQQRPGDARDFGAVVGRSSERLAAGYDRITALPKRPRELKLERHRASAHVVGAEPPPERVGVGYQHARQIE